MSEVSLEMLIAYADGELGPAESRQVESYIAQNPHAARVVERMRRGRLELSRIFNEPMRTPVPDRLVQTVMSAPIGGANVVHLDTARSRFSLMATSPRRNWPRLALAASAAGILLVGAGWLLRDFVVRSETTASRGGHTIDRPALADMALRNALETGRSAMPIALASGGTVEPILTFWSKSGQPCRLYELKTGDAQTYRGISCRAGDGGWHVEIIVSGSGAGIVSDKTKPVGDGAMSGPSPVDGRMASLREGDVLGADEERALIGNKWKRPQ